MNTSDNIQVLQSNFDENLEQRVIVQLTNPSSNNRENSKKAKSGLVRISSLKQLRYADKKLRQDFKFWMPPSCQLNEVGNAGSPQTRTKSVEFNDVARAIEYIKSCNDKRIILILSSDYARDKKMISEFKKFPQIAMVYHCVPETLANKWFERCSYEAQFFTPKMLPNNVLQHRVQDLNEASQLLLMQLFFTEIILKLPERDEAKEDFLHFCRLTYKDHHTNLTKVEEFEANYNENDAVKWYTKSDGFIFRIVCRACASFNFDTFFKVRFLLRDLHMQLQKLHQEQLPTLLHTDLVVYRGAKITLEELSRLRVIGNLFVTRNFLSATTEEDVAYVFSGKGAVSENQISALISMHIDREELSEKPVAFIAEVGQFLSEAEVMLSMGMVFRVVSCEEIKNVSTHSVKIRVVRRKEEQEIEKELIRVHLLGSMAFGSPILSMADFLSSMENSEYCAQYCNIMSRALKSSDPQVSEQLENMPQNNVQPSLTNIAVEPVANATARTNHIAHTTRLTSIFQQPPAYTIAIVIATLIIASTIVIPLSILLTPEENSTVCPLITCSTNFFMLNPSPNYQVEHLNLNCSQSLSNLTIIQIVQRTFNETHAQQYQTFWNASTNMTYIETPTEIIYTCYSLLDMLILKESFPHFIEAQYYYKARSARNTSGDTWQIRLQSICKDFLYLSGTF